MTEPFETSDEQRDELVEQVAREIQLRGLTAPAVGFLEASRPYRPLGANAMLFFDPVMSGLFGGDDASASEILADDTGIDDVPSRDEEDGSIALPVSVPGDVRAVDTLRLAFAFGTRSRKRAATIYARGPCGPG